MTDQEKSTLPPPRPYQPHIAQTVPPELAERKIWVAWKLKERPDKKPAKIPVSPADGRTKGWNTDPAFCTDLQTAQRYARDRGLTGIGIVLHAGDGIAGIDLDGVRNPETGALTRDAEGVVRDADTYFEVSPGLGGVRGFALGSFGGHTTGSRPLPGGGNIELYEDNRFLTVTGWHIPDTPEQVKRRDLTALGERYGTAVQRVAAAEEEPPEMKEISPEYVDLWFGLTDHQRATLDGDLSAYGDDGSKAVFGIAKDLYRLGLDAAEILSVLYDSGLWAVAERRKNPERWVWNYCIRPAIDDCDPGFERIQDERRRGFRLTPIGELFKQQDALSWLIKGYLLPNTLSQVFGDPACGKSLLVLDWAASLASGRDWQGHKTKQATVVYLAGEGQRGVRWRMLAWAQHHDVDLTDAPLFVSNQGAQLNDRDHLDKVIASIDALPTPSPPALIIIDTLHRNFSGDENSAQDAGAYVAACDALRLRYDACVLTVHHSGIGDKDRGRGSSAFRGAYDTEFRVKLDKGIRALTCTKMKDAEPPPESSFALRIVKLPETDEDGKAITSVVLEGTVPPKQVSDSQRIAFQTLINAICTTGTEPPGGGGHRATTLEHWRSAFYRQYAKTDPANRKAFNRALKDLLNLNVVQQSDTHYYPTSAASEWPDLNAILTEAQETHPFDFG